MGVKQKFWKGLFVAGGAGVAALAAVNASIARGVPAEAEDNLLGGEPRAFASQYGSVYYRAAGIEGREPLVLLHDIGAGASSFMWRKNFDALASDFRVYAPDLLGFGLSDKPANAPYSADLYVALIRDFLTAELPRHAPAAHLVAGGLTAAFAVRVADEHPALVRSLTLIAPTGALDSRPDLPGAAFYGLLHSPVLGESFYNAMTSERSLRDYAAKRLFYERRFATERLVAHYYTTSHQPGAQHAVAAFLSGYLNADIREAFARLAPKPVTLLWGREDVTTPLAQAEALLSLNPHARLEIFERCRMTPQTEHAAKFNELLRTTLLARPAAA